jgi:putative hydrolase of the HAD superfamily
VSLKQYIQPSLKSCDNPQVQAVFFDAAGTLIHLRESVGASYSRLAERHGVKAAPEQFETAFRRAWKMRPQPQHHGIPPNDGDRGWWAGLVDDCFAETLGARLPAEIMKPLFEDLYAWFAQPEAWRAYPEVRQVLEELRSRFRLFILSNFDARLKGILDGLNLLPLFESVVISSETGYSKPHKGMFIHAARLAGLKPDECLHVGDEKQADFQGAVQAGFQACLVERPEFDLSTALLPCLQGGRTAGQCISTATSPSPPR